MGNLMVKNSVRAMRYFGYGAKESALFLDKALLIQENKERFGRSYDKATMWYSLIHKKSVSKFDYSDYEDCYQQWNIMVALGQMVTPVELENGSKENVLSLETRFIKRTFEICAEIFNLQSDAQSEEDKLDFINSCLNQFKRQTVSETLHKASCRILKMSFEDINESPNGEWVFDSRKATKATSGTSMRWILTAEDGISRLLSDMGREQVVVNLNTTETENGSKEQEAKNSAVKEQIFLHGIRDIATGKHYLCSAPSASSTRHVDFPFVVADKPEEIYDLWCQITGFSDITELVGNIGHRNDDGSITMVFAKVKARIAQNGANSLSTGKTASERIRERLRNANVVFVPDCKGSIDIPYKKISAIGVLSMEHPDGTVTSERVE